jgi:hypothetical protein
MRARARTALIGVVLLLLVFLIATRLGEEDRPALGVGSNSEVAEELPSDPPNDPSHDPPTDPPIAGARRSLIQDWKPSEVAEAAPKAAPAPEPLEQDPELAPDPAQASEEEAKHRDAWLSGGDRRFGEGRIEGRVIFSGPIPAPEIVNKSIDPKCPPTEIRHAFRVDDRGGLAGAITWVAIDQRADYGTPAKLVLRYRDCCMEPEIVALRVGQTLEIVNEDPFLHNAHAIVKQTEFNRALPTQGMRISKIFGTADVEGLIACEVHPWENGRIYVFAHPFFALTDDAGRFVIDRLPGEGPYRLIVQHPSAGNRELAVVSGAVEIDLSRGAL